MTGHEQTGEKETLQAVVVSIRTCLPNDEKSKWRLYEDVATVYAAFGRDIMIEFDLNFAFPATNRIADAIKGKIFILGYDEEQI